MYCSFNVSVPIYFVYLLSTNGTVCCQLTKAPYICTDKLATLSLGRTFLRKCALSFIKNYGCSEFISRNIKIFLANFHCFLCVLFHDTVKCQGYIELMVYASNNRAVGTGGMILTADNWRTWETPIPEPFCPHKCHTDNPRTEPKPLQSENDI